MARKPLDVVGTTGLVGKHDFRTHVHIKGSPELTKALKTLLNLKPTTVKLLEHSTRNTTAAIQRDAMGITLGQQVAKDFFSAAPRYRTKKRLAELIDELV